MATTATPASSSPSKQRAQLAEQIALNADVGLQFDDGSTLMVSSAFISVFSSVLRGAVEANRGAAAEGTNTSTSSATSSASAIPINGVTKAEWLQAASFWYPVVPSPDITDWKQAELLLRIGTQFDIPLLLHKVGTHLHDKLLTMTTLANSEANIWHWIKQADKAGLRVLPAMLRHVVLVDRPGCVQNENLQGLSSATLLQLVKGLASPSGPGALSSAIKRRYAPYPVPRQQGN